MRWTLQQIASATDGLAVGDAVVTSVSTDSRAAANDALFVALRGDQADGHEFVRDALGNGAAAALVERGRLPQDAAGVEVDDTLVALGGLATHRRSELDIPVVAVTGSTGKTTTKDMIAALLGSGAHAAPRSYNNEIGVPLTILGCPDDAEALVAEVGSRGIGHIRALAPMVKPDVAVITNIGPAHLEMFGDVPTVRKAKWELVELLPEEGVAVLPAAETELVAMRTGPLITFGEGEGDVAVTGVSLDAMGRATFSLDVSGATHAVTLPVAGRHQPHNAAAAVAAAVALGRDGDTMVGRLVDIGLSPWRMDVTTQAVHGGEITLVNDAYNANPTSMASALETVASMPGRHVAVLGMMYELGAEAADMHAAIGRKATDLGFTVVVVGDDPGIAHGAGDRTLAVGSLDEAASLLPTILEPGDVVLIKASRAAGLEVLPSMLGGEAP